MEWLGSVQNLSHIRSGDGFGLRDLRLIERPHVHVAFSGPGCAGDVAQPCCSQVETGLAVRECSDNARPPTDFFHEFEAWSDPATAQCPKRPSRPRSPKILTNAKVESVNYQAHAARPQRVPFTVKAQDFDPRRVVSQKG